MPIGELFLGAFLQVVFDRIAPREVKEFIRRLELNLDDDLETLEQTMLIIQAVLHDAEHKQITNKAVRDWLEKLTHLAYDIDDLFDEIATDAARLKLKEEYSRSDTNQVRDFSSILNYWSDSKKSGKIKKLIERFGKVEKRMLVLGLLLGEQSSNIIPVSLQRPPTSSLPLDSCVYGREQVVEKLLKLLSDDETGDQDNKVSVIPIVGMGGVGKTTLAQHLYNHEEVSKRFNLKVWVCVSDAKFDLIRVTKEILESATKESSTLQGLQVLQERLKDILSQKKFLLVLDDVWSEDYGDWDHLRAPFKDGPRGSKIIVTTRSENVSSMMKTVSDACHLRELSEEDCQSLFNQHAYVNGNPNAHPELKPIGEKIVKKCKGLPLAAKTLGGLLRCKLRTVEWEGILNSKIWEDETGILPSLRLSYHYLPAHLKQCFSYCAIFPQDYEFDKNKLVLLWMAEGFLQSHQRNKRMEDLGDEYFRDLLSRSFFQRSSNNESRYVMHDLIHDLAQSVSRGICFCFKDGLQGDKLSEVDKSLVRYTLAPLRYYKVMARFEAFHESKSLRTLLLISSSFGEGDSYIPKKIPQYLISKLPCLRVLCFGNCTNLYELPESIGNLKHLRYIDLSKTSIERLPESMSTLLNLQTLILRNCKRLVELLNGMGNLINLHHLYIDGCYSLREMPLGIDKLTNLQTLPMFIVGENSGSRIEELIDMKQLRDNKLRIIGLKNVVDNCGAILGNKEHLDELHLNWSFSYDKNSEREDIDLGDGSREVEIINELQPHTNLKRIAVSCYYDSRFPDWLGYSSYSNLVNLVLIDCRRCQFLPPLGCLPSLKNLQIKGLWRVKTVGSEFYGRGVLHTSKPPFQSLERLVFEDMRDWDEWSGIVEEREEEFPSLRQLKIMSCPKLRKFSHRFVKLEELRLQQCGELIALPMCLPVLNKLHIMECNEMVLRSVVASPSPSLASLNLSKISNLENSMLPLEGGRSLLGPLTVVKKLENDKSVERMRYSMSYEIGRVSQLRACFRSLDISGCPQLVCLSNDEDVLSLGFTMSSCQNLHFFKFPSGIERLTIHNCPGFVSFPTKMELPSTLRHLEIFHCNNLKTFPELVMGNGTNDQDSIFLDVLCTSDCDSLTSFTRSCSSSGGLPLLPKHLIIRNCPNLVSPPEVMMYKNRFLESLIIEGCDKITSFSSSGRCLGGFDPYIVVAHNMNDDLPSSSQAKSGMMTSVLPTTITNVKQIKIGLCKNLNSLPDSLYKLTSLRRLKIWRCPSLVSFPDGGLPTTTLTEFTISGCPSLVSFPDGGLRTSTLTDFTISGCKNLNSLPDDLYKLTSLRNLNIERCPSLVSFPDGGLPTTTLTDFSIKQCENLRFLPDGLHNVTSLIKLQTWDCPKLDPFPEGGFPSNLEKLEVVNCGGQKPMAEWGLRNLTSLHRLQIGGFPGLVVFPELLLPHNLTHLDISYLPDLQFLPEGLRNLTCLEVLRIWNCDKLASFPEKGLPSSLQQLIICHCDKIASLLKKELPSSLPKLTIYDCNKLESFPEKWLPSSLQELNIQNCNKLASFPEKWLPSSLGFLYINNCPLLEEWFDTEKGKDWMKTSDIPYIKIDGFC